MIIEELFLSSTPCDEKCAQVGTPNYTEMAKKECRAYINQLIREFGEPPENTYIKIKGCPHDFGTYYEVIISFDTSSVSSTKYAYNMENNTPLNWDKEALIELTN